MARIGPNDRIGPPLVTYSPEQLAEIDALRARIAELEGKLAAIVKWLEENQPDVFRRGLWDEISDPTAQALARLVEAAIQARPYARFTLELRDAVDAYLAARSGRREGE